VKAAVERGQAMFVQYCSACHGKGGTGDGPAAGHDGVGGNVPR
jgi:mono/diheme cytochrome c family protein